MRCPELQQQSEGEKRSVDTEGEFPSDYLTLGASSSNLHMKFLMCCPQGQTLSLCVCARVCASALSIAGVNPFRPGLAGPPPAPTLDV